MNLALSLLPSLSLTLSLSLSLSDLGKWWSLCVFGQIQFRDIDEWTSWLCEHRGLCVCCERVCIVSV